RFVWITRPSLSAIITAAPRWSSARRATEDFQPRLCSSICSRAAWRSGLTSACSAAGRSVANGGIYPVMDPKIDSVRPVLEEPGPYTVVDTALEKIVIIPLVATEQGFEHA